MVIRRTQWLMTAFLVIGGTIFAMSSDLPNIVLVMSDDQGWGQTGYYRHPLLKTPNLDAMAANGLRLDRFYAGAPVCSPTRATVMTGRTNDRCGVFDHGFGLHLQERVLPKILQRVGYVTGHFGKWHLNGYQGPGVPILGSDDHHPGHFGFDEWLSVSNFFDRDPIMSRMGNFEERHGDSSEIIVDEALAFIARQVSRGKPFLTVIWYGSPHDPFDSILMDQIGFEGLDDRSRRHYGELVAMDRSMGSLRRGLRKLGIEHNTLVWFNSDNGGLPRIEPSSVGRLRGFKGSLYEGGLRVPGIVEWPAVISPGRNSSLVSGTVDILPTLIEIVGLPTTALLRPYDGVSLYSLLKGDELEKRRQPLFFRHKNRGALISNSWKLVVTDIQKKRYELYNLDDDDRELDDQAGQHGELLAKLVKQFALWNRGVERSQEGLDYPEGRVSVREPGRRLWMTSEEYRPFLERFRKRPEYRSRIEAAVRKY